MRNLTLGGMEMLMVMEKKDYQMFVMLGLVQLT
jgi:hypothetical protein